MLKKLCLILTLALVVALPAWGQSNTGGTLMPSGAYTATVTSGDMDNVAYHGVHVIINVSSYTSGNFTPKIQAKDPASGVYYDLLVGSAISSTGTTVLKVYPGLATSANAAAADFLPRTWRVTMIGASTPVATFSVSFFYEI